MNDGVMRLVLETPEGFTAGLTMGASIAVNGVCLTVVEWHETEAHFDVIDESLRRSNLGCLVPGHQVNLERAARFGDEIGGHPLSGHIHTEAQVTRIEVEGGNQAIEMKVDETWWPYVISKGYIAINGCSLTVGEVNNGHFWVHLIPETLRITNLDQCTVGTRLNIEIDHQTQVIVDTVERYMAKKETTA